VIKSYNVDDPSERAALIAATPTTGFEPRRTRYGNERSYRIHGVEELLRPIESRLTTLVDPADYADVLRWGNDEKVFPRYWQYSTWAPNDGSFRWNQDGLGYCWAWGMTASLMDCRALEGKPTKLLSPVSLGWLVNWQNRGNYLESALRGINERGVCEMEYTPDQHRPSPGSFKNGWEENALLYRLGEIWDLDTSSDARTIQHCVTTLASAISIYAAWNWWNHALCLVGMTGPPWAWQLRNSHNETDVIELTGSRAVPDEAYGVRATLFTGA
jgi:hypothetical protein